MLTQAEVAKRIDPTTGRIRVWDIAGAKHVEMYPIDVRQALEQSPPAVALDAPSEAVAAPAEPAPEAAHDFTQYPVGVLHAFLELAGRAVPAIADRDTLVAILTDAKFVPTKAQIAKAKAKGTGNA